MDTFGPRTVNVNGGSIDNLSINDTSIGNVTGGTIFNGFGAFGTSTANVTGGSIFVLKTSDAGTANVTGGMITNSLSTSNTSILDLLGTGFTETPLPYNGLYPRYAVTGILQNGDPLQATYDYFGGTLEFNGAAAQPVPEASTTISFGLLLCLGLGGLAVSARRRKAQYSE